MKVSYYAHVKVFFSTYMSNVTRQTAKVFEALPCNCRVTHLKVFVIYGMCFINCSMSLHDVISFVMYVYVLYGQLLRYTSLFEQIEGDTLPELSVAGHGVVLTLLSLLKQTFQKVEGTSSGI